MKRLAALASAVLAAAAAPAFAQHDHSGHSMPMSMGAAQAAPAKEFTRGEVRGIDRQAGKITLKHGEIANLGMPPMTMVFKAKDPAALDKVNVGDAVAFKAESVGGVYTVIELKLGS